MDINVCKLHHHHHRHPHQQENHQTGNDMVTDRCPDFNSSGINSGSCVMSRLSPFNDGHGAVPLSQDACAPFSVMESPTLFHPSSNSSMPIGFETTSCLIQPYNRVIHSPCLQLDGLRYESTGNRLHPHSPVCMVPLPEYIGEPSFIRRRNERERERVRCVNDGYDKLKEHLPLADKDRRLSKVETLRGAIKYIRQLKRLLEDSDDEMADGCRINCVNRGKIFLSSSRKQRRSSLSSSDQDSSLSDS